MPAVSRFGGLAFLTIVACWTSPATPTQSPSVLSLEPAKHDLSGKYWCSIDEGGYEYPRYACVIKKVGEDMVLAKLTGSQRIKGRITVDETNGFGFVGELYCPWGDCRQELHGSFKPAGNGFKGKFREDAMVVHLTPAPANAFGGDGYGGDEYGDPFDVDGSYGGASYGRRNYRIDIRGRRRP